MVNSSVEFQLLGLWFGASRVELNFWVSHSEFRAALIIRQVIIHFLPELYYHYGSGSQ